MCLKALSQVYLAGNALAERKFDLGLIGAGRKEALLNQHEMTYQSRAFMTTSL
jgi:hypothetical protein